MFDKRFKRKKFHPIKILFFVGMFALFVAAVGAVVMFLWNAIIPDVTGWKPLTYWQALGLLILFKILFGGLGKGGRPHWRDKHKRKKEWKQKWMNMSSEEKAEMKEKWKSYCNRRGSDKL